ncbi:helix-turn-helix domain-containing protein [Actinosynnema sp. NPDC004786]
MGRGVLEGAFSVLEELIDAGESGLSELAARTGLPKTTVHRLLDQLVRLGAVERRDGRYRTGVAMFRLGSGWRLGADLRSVALHPMRQLAAAVSGASVVVAVPDGECTFIVGACHGEAHDVLPLRAGVRFPAEGAWRQLFRLARDEDGVLRTYESTCSQDVAGVSAAVYSGRGEVVGAVSASVLDRRRVPAMVPAVRHAARLVSASLARIGRTVG